MIIICCKSFNFLHLLYIYFSTCFIFLYFKSCSRLPYGLRNYKILNGLGSPIIFNFRLARNIQAEDEISWLVGKENKMCSILTFDIVRRKLRSSHQDRLVLNDINGYRSNYITTVPFHWFVGQILS